MNNYRTLKVIFIFAIIYPNVSLGQYSWFHSFEGSDYVTFERMAFDAHGNSLITTGNFGSSIIVNNDLISGSGSILLKLNLDGEVLWYSVIRYAPTLLGFGTNQVRTDAFGNIYISGSFYEWVQIDNIVLTAEVKGSFIAKFNSDGDLLWAKKIEYLQNIDNLAVNDEGNIAISGMYHQEVIIDHIKLTTPFMNIFGAFLNSDGVVQWAKDFGSLNAITNSGISLNLDKDNNFYFCGRYTGPLQIGGALLSNTTSSNFNIFFCKINEQGDFEWVKQFNRKVHPDFEGSNLVGEHGSLTTDANGNTYICGSFYYEINIDGHIIKTVEEHPVYGNLYVAKFNPSGEFQWITPIFLDNYHYSMFAENIEYINGYLYISGKNINSPYYFVIDTLGEKVTDFKNYSIICGLGGGLAVDKQGGIYISGRYTNDLVFGQYKGFIFKAEEWIGNARSIQAPNPLCSAKDVTLFTEQIAQATHYEWEIQIDNKETTVIVTDSAYLTIYSTLIENASHVSIRVRGVVSDKRGKFSSLHVFPISKPKAPPIISMNCNNINVIGGENLFWYLNEELIQGSSDQQNLTATISGQYYVVEYDLCGQYKSNIIDYYPIQLESLFTPTIITPNGDPYNEYFVIDPLLEGASISVINRWGNIVYMSAQYKNDWNGGDNPSGVYYYSIRHSCFSLKGTLTIAR